MKKLYKYILKYKAKEYSYIVEMQDFLDALIKKDPKKLTIDNLVSSIGFDTFEFNDGNLKFKKPEQMVEYLKKNLNESLNLGMKITLVAPFHYSYTSRKQMTMIGLHSR